MIKIIKEKNKTYVVEDTISGRKESINGIYKIFFTCLYSFIPDQQRGESLLNIEELDSDKFLIIETWEKSRKWFRVSRKLVNKELRLKNFLFHLPSDLKLGVFTDICYKTSSGDWILRDEYIGVFKESQVYDILEPYLLCKNLLDWPGIDQVMKEIVNELKK